MAFQATAQHGGNRINSEENDEQTCVCTSCVQSPISPLQEARLIIEAFPCRYEPLTLCNCIAAIENQVGPLVRHAFYDA